MGLWVLKVGPQLPANLPLWPFTSPILPSIIREAIGLVYVYTHTHKHTHRQTGIHTCTCTRAHLSLSFKYYTLPLVKAKFGTF